jgi:hypothetical protein
MSATFTPYLASRSGCTPADTIAYIRVRVPDGPRPDGSTLVYLADGTGLVVNGHHLLHLDSGPNASDEEQLTIDDHQFLGVRRTPRP